MNTHLKKSLAALYSIYLHLANIPAEKIKSNQVKSILSLKASQISSHILKKKS